MKIIDPYHMKIVAIHMEGPVVPWFQMIQKFGNLSSWPDLVFAVDKCMSMLVLSILALIFGMII